MKIQLDKLGKRFNDQWIFRDVDFLFEQGKRYVILGSNGSGKSTLLQTIAGFRIPSQGEVSYRVGDIDIQTEQYFKQISIAAPYLELIEEFTLDEVINFHFRFKTPHPHLPPEALTASIKLENEWDKPIRYFSSGMKQRVRLALAFYSHTPILLLDEPLSNLDQFGYEWYRNMLDHHTSDRLVIICSNHKPEEFEPADNVLEMSNYKS